jgi:hypothetical protein
MTFASSPTAGSEMQAAKQIEEQAHGTRFRPGHSGNPAGRRRAKDVAREDEAAAAVEAQAIANELGRVPTALERVLIAEIAALSVKAKRLRSEGRPCDDVVRLLSRMCGQLGLNRAAPRARPQPELAALLKGGAGA